MNNRRKLVIALSASAIAPRIGWAQASRRPVVGVIRVNPRNINETFVEPFRRDMASLGWKENDNIEFVFAWAEGHNEVLPKLAADMVARRVDVIVTFGPEVTRAAQSATPTIPIVAMTDNLVDAGLVQSMARPGGHTTGVSLLRGANPADLPAEQPTKFELIFNGKTAKALGLKIPQALLLRADQVVD